MKSNVLILLLVAALIASVTSHRHLSAETGSQALAGRELSEDAVERQRILAELEEVHQLRERMLQEGKNFASTARQLLTFAYCGMRFESSSDSCVARDTLH